MGRVCRPDVPTQVIIGREDRFFRADWLRGVVRDRLGIEPDELAGGHTLALSHPRELVELMESQRPRQRGGLASASPLAAAVRPRARQAVPNTPNQ